MANKHPNTSGLKPFSKSNSNDIAQKEKEKEIQRKGGIARSEQKKEIKQFKERLQIFLETPINDKLPDEYTIMNLAKYLLKPENAKEFFDALNLRLKIMGDINENQITINNNQKELTKEELKELYKKMKE